MRVKSTTRAAASLAVAIAFAMAPAVHLTGERIASMHGH